MAIVVHDSFLRRGLGTRMVQILGSGHAGWGSHMLCITSARPA